MKLLNFLIDFSALIACTNEVNWNDTQAVESRSALPHFKDNLLQVLGSQMKGNFFKFPRTSKLLLKHLSFFGPSNVKSFTVSLFDLHEYIRVYVYLNKWLGYCKRSSTSIPYESKFCASVSPKPNSHFKSVTEIISTPLNLIVTTQWMSSQLTIITTLNNKWGCQ